MKPYPGTYEYTTKEALKKYLIIVHLELVEYLVENVFEIKSSVFRVLRKLLLVEPENATINIVTTYDTGIRFTS